MPLFLKSYPEESVTLHFGDSSTFPENCNELFEISFCLLEFVYPIVYLKLNFQGSVAPYNFATF